MEPLSVDWLKEGIALAPSVSAVLIIVYMFLRYLSTKEKQDSMDFDKRDETIKVIAERAFKAHEETNKVIRENTEVMGQVKLTLIQNTTIMDHVTRTLEDLQRG